MKGKVKKTYQLLPSENHPTLTSEFYRVDKVFYFMDDIYADLSNGFGGYIYSQVDIEGLNKCNDEHFKIKRGVFVPTRELKFKIAQLIINPVEDDFLF